jgi:hypothetical protein
MQTNLARLLGVVGWVTFLTTATLASESAKPPDLYVATNGDDAWSGHLPAPNAVRTDGPKATLAAARDALRRIRNQKSEIRNPATVHVRGGVYRLDAPFVLEPQDSGVTFAVYQKEKPVFSGGRVITGFRRNGKLWEAEIPEVKAGQWYFRQLFVNSQRRQRARSPNTGYYRVASQLPGPRDSHGKEIAREKFVFKAGDLQPWARLGDANVVLMHSWETSIHPLKSVDTASNIVTFAAPLKEWWCIGYWEKNQRYYVENALELLDQPGEWYLNRETGVLSYWPLPGERLGKTEVVAPRLTELVRFAGNADEGRFVQNVTLRGLAFHHSDWVLDPKGNSSTQAAVEVPAAVMADGALNCAFERCEVAHVGTYGIWFRRGCKDCRIQQNRLHDLGAGGVRVGEDKMAKSDVAESSRVLVDNNYIFDGGRVYAAGVGIWVAQSSHNQISHNDIHDLLYSGMSIGWNWGQETNRTHHNVIEFNHVHDCAHGTLSDAGLIYTLGVSPGSVIRNNILHDLWPYGQPALGWGIYLDGQTGNYVVESNLVFNTLSGGLMFNNGGHAHLIRNNIFALSANQALWPYSEKRPSALRNNIVFLTQGTLLIPHGERSLNERLAAKEPPGNWDGNVYWHTGGADQLRFYRRTFAEWQTLGLDQHSVIADPLFANAARHDFRLKPASPALKLGFQPIDTSHVGLYGDAAWIAEARHAKCRLHPLPPPLPTPKPLTVNDNFEKTAVGLPPDNAHVDGEQSGASIRVSDERAASGKRSLKITDSKSLKPTWQPHFYYTPHLTSGTVRASFDAWLAPEAQFFTEWRDSSAYPQNVGPSICFNGNGWVSTGGKSLARMPANAWFHVEIEATLSKDGPRTFKLTLTPSGGAPQVFSDLPISGANFHEIHWLGFSSTAAADTTFFLDNLRITKN